MTDAAMPTMATALRVVHLSVVHRPGDARIFDRECRTLADAGYDVTFLVPGASGDAALGNPRQVALPARGRTRRWMSAYEIARELRRLRPHVLHVHDPELLTIVPACKAIVPRVIYDMHEYLPEQIAIKPYIPDELRPAVAGVARVAQRTLARACDGVIAAAPAMLETLGGRPVPRVALENFPRFSRFAAATPRPDVAADSRLKLIHVGGLSAARGLFLMLDVMAALEPELPVVLYLAGRYADPADEETVGRRVAGELAGRVVLLGELKPADVPGYLAAADVAWSPILGGPQFSKPNVLTKIYEGMAAGTATLVSNVADHGEPVRREQCGLSVPASVEGHLSGVRRLLAARGELAAMGERGRTAVRERYSWESIEGRLVGFYARLCEGLGQERGQ